MRKFTYFIITVLFSFVLLIGCSEQNIKYIVSIKLTETTENVVAVRVYGGASNIIVRDNIAQNAVFVFADNDSCIYENNIVVDE